MLLLCNSLSDLCGIGLGFGVTMRRLLLAATALTVAGPALAAPPAPANNFSWTGCYLGVNVDPGFGDATFSNSTTTAPRASDSVHVGSGVGALGGEQIGCNLQVARNWVLGVEGDFGWSNISGNSADPFFSGKNLSSRTDWITSVTGRVGYTWDNWMFYGKGGVAGARNQYAFSATEVSVDGMTLFRAFNETGADTPFGLTLGSGIEWAFAPAWSARIEFDYYGFGPRTLTLFDAATSMSSGPISIKQNIEAIRFGINYQFWTGGSFLSGN
jgi:outer membrane immunogenic protein